MLRDLSRNSNKPVLAVSEAPPPDPVALHPIGRIALGLLGAAMFAVLVVAALIEPDPRGFGSHEQLGLPPCWFQQHYGTPCPSCGMTTSFAHLVRLDLPAALQANVAGTLLASGLFVAMPWSLGSAMAGRLLGGHRAYVGFLWAVLIVVVAAAIQWSAWLTR